MMASTPVNSITVNARVPLPSFEVVAVLPGREVESSAPSFFNFMVKAIV